MTIKKTYDNNNHLLSILAANGRGEALDDTVNVLFITTSKMAHHKSSTASSSLASKEVES
jgi:hypothetical protein